MTSIYCIYNKISGKYYVGKTKNSILLRWKDHRAYSRSGIDTLFKRAIRKYPKESFEVWQLTTADSEEQATLLERLWIIALDACNRDVGYNLTYGGDGMSHPTKEVRERISKTIRERKHRHTPEARAKISAAGRGRRHTQESIEKMRVAAFDREARFRQARPKKPPKVKKVRVFTEAYRRILGERARSYNLGRKLTEEHKRKISESNKGRVCSEETRRKIGLAHKGKPGHRQSEDTRRKISAAHKGRKKPKRYSQMAKEEAGKNSLVSQTAQQIDSYHAKGSDFSVKKVKAATDQSGERGMSEGQDMLATLSENQEGPRHCEDGGSMKPTEWQSGGRSKTVAKCFPVGTNKGEGEDSPSKMSIAVGVDFMTGKITGGNLTRVDSVYEDKVSIGR